MLLEMEVSLMFNLTIDNFETLVDIEVALENEIETFNEYGSLSDREAETLTNLIWVYNQVKTMREPITLQKIKDSKQNAK